MLKLTFLVYFNINLWQNGHSVFQKYNLLLCQSVPNDVKNYFDFCRMFGLKMLIESPAWITCSNSSMINHILASFPNRVIQWSILNVELSDHQIIYCTRKITRLKIGVHKQIKANKILFFQKLYHWWLWKSSGWN